MSYLEPHHMFTGQFERRLETVILIHMAWLYLYSDSRLIFIHECIVSVRKQCSLQMNINRFSLRHHDWYIILPIQKLSILIFLGFPKSRFFAKMFLIKTFQRALEAQRIVQGQKKAGGHFFAFFYHFDFPFSSTVISQMEPIYVCVLTLINFVQCVQKSEQRRELLSERGRKKK